MFKNYGRIFNRDELKNEFKKSVVGYMTAAFGLIAGLAWNEAIKSLIDFFFPEGGNSILAKFIYAILITIIVVIITYLLFKFAGRQDQKN